MEESEKFFKNLEKYKNDAIDDLPLHPSGIKPDWYDANLLAQGQRFIKENYSNVSVSELVSLYILFAFSDNLDTLILTRQSDTIETATKRYYDTVMRVKSWSESDPWDRTSEAYKNIVVVRSLHSRTSRKLNSKGKDLEKELEPIKAAWGGDCPVAYLDKTTNSSFSKNLELVNNSDKRITQPKMTLTLFGFMGLTLLYPEKFGIFNATNEDLTAFVHFWRNIGLLLGVKDDINFCRGSLDEVKARCRAFLEMAVIPNLYDLNKNWEHMSKCMIQGSEKFLYVVDFETSLMYLFWVLDLKCDQFKNTVSFWKHLKFHIYLFGVRYLQRCFIFKQFINFFVRIGLVAFGQSKTYAKLKNS